MCPEAAPGAVPPTVVDGELGAERPVEAPANGTGIREYIVNVRKRPAGFFDDPHFTAGLVVFGMVTGVFAVIWLYRYVMHDPLADAGTGEEILALLLLIAGLVAVRRIVLTWGRS